MLKSFPLEQNIATEQSFPRQSFPRQPGIILSNDKTTEYQETIMNDTKPRLRKVLHVTQCADKKTHYPPA